MMRRGGYRIITRKMTRLAFTKTASGSTYQSGHLTAKLWLDDGVWMHVDGGVVPRAAVHPFEGGDVVLLM